jgi:hypothetical protein
MLPGLALVIGAAVLIVAGYENRAVIDVLLGLKREQPGGSPEFSDTPSAAENPTQAAPGLTGSLQQAISGLGTFDGKPVAGWIIPVLKWARKNGWKGQVTSGWRDPKQVVTPSPGLPVAPQGQSNHRGKRWPLGAVDVSDPETLAKLVPHYPGPGPTLKWGGPVIGDPVHFSATGH